MTDAPPPPPASDPTHGGSPDNNPKTQYGIRKVPLHLVPPIAMAHCATAFADGAKKYGPYNWRQKMVSATVYHGAALRHMMAWFDGEDIAPDSGCHHLAHAMACLSIILDGEALGPERFNDDRPTPGAISPFLEEYAKRMGIPVNPNVTQEGSNPS